MALVQLIAHILTATYESAAMRNIILNSRLGYTYSDAELVV